MLQKKCITQFKASKGKNTNCIELLTFMVLYFILILENDKAQIHYPICDCNYFKYGLTSFLKKKNKKSLERLLSFVFASLASKIHMPPVTLSKSSSSKSWIFSLSLSIFFPPKKSFYTFRIG